MAHILIAEDEDGIARVIDRGLRGDGHRTTLVTDGIAALEAASSGQVDLVVLDVGLPKMDGFTVLRMLRTMDEPVPVIMCTARDSVEDTVHGLESGAEDYLPKPFRVEELRARVKLRLRQHAEAQGGGRSDDVFEEGGVRLDIPARTVTVDGRQVELSAREFTLARELMDHAGQVLSRDQLLDRVWGFEVTGSSNVVDVYIRYLRSKLGADRITTVRGVGYRFEH
ncbi:Response regulator receiver:Transcriptional regulatory protein, C terminal [Serinicoccus hydrothermalis]|uniref:Response regulator receiver:Transcriptional regulatory protein, C terminal n=1 Tax=Serinicoccus hydrothermalis TaxID=1758689 RepID=A0A1B1NEG8_9MICO|nr:response regulator transcription factor [Serinicoccus hydrothermalis]ANS79834.1 Response regulator receiver:Transcriptional regulatory protein, C terminal [Serinicoccus hydrothermalis]